MGIEDVRVAAVSFFIFLIGMSVTIWMMWPRLARGITRYTKYRGYFLIGLVVLIVGILLTIVDILAGPGLSQVSLIMFVGGMISVAIGVANKDKW